MKSLLLVTKTSFLLIYIILTFSCSQDDSLFAELIAEDTTLTDTTTSEDTTSDTVIDYENGSLEISEDNSVVLDIVSYDEATTTSKIYSLNDITQPTNGKTELNSDNEITYTPESDFNGNDAFSVTVNEQDSLGITVETTTNFEVIINPVTDVVDDEVTTTFETAVTIEPLSNDTFNETTSVAITEISLASKGTATLNSDNTIDYTPSDNISGTDEISYKTTVTYTDDTTTTETGAITVTILSNEYPTGDNIKYVTTTGSSSNSGETEETAWDITHAFETAEAGDIIYIKAGNYGALNLVVANSGTSGSPIEFIGYKTIPGDIVSTSEASVSYDDYKRNGDDLDESVMPLIHGEFTDNIGVGTGVFISKTNIKVSNFQVRGFNNNFVGQGDNNEFINIISSEAGNFSDSSYTGTGIRISGDNTIVQNCLSINASAEGMTFTGDNQEHDNNKVYCDNTTNPTDYYYLLTTADNFTINNPYIERVGELSHYGHGLVLKVSASENTINYGNVINTSLEVSFTEVTNNTFNNCFIGDYDETARGSILIANGAHDNTFNEAIVKNSNSGCVRFSDWIDGSDNEGDANDAGNNNLFKSCQFIDSDAGIDFYEWDKLDGAAHNNTFQLCEFSNLDYLFRVNRPNYENVLIECKITNVDEYETNRGGEYASYTLSVVIDELTTFLNNSFEDPN
jgi:hypothetical protein